MYKCSPTNTFCSSDEWPTIHTNNVTSASSLAVISPALKEPSRSPLYCITEDNAITNGSCQEARA